MRWNSHYTLPYMYLRLEGLLFAHRYDLSTNAGNASKPKICRKAWMFISCIIAHTLVFDVQWACQRVRVRDRDVSVPYYYHWCDTTSWTRSRFTQACGSSPDRWSDRSPIPLGTRRYCAVTLIQRRNNVLCLVGYGHISEFLFICFFAIALIQRYLLLFTYFDLQLSYVV